MAAVIEKEVSVFNNGRSRAVRIPSDFQLEGDSVLMSQDEDGVIHIRPKKPKKSLLEVLDWLAQQEPFEERMPEIEDYPPEPVDLGKR
ncbi:antitoxin [Agrobacterium larrymoorei]|uniref:AbrB/MazE/SpoVT family DNA-binding domain-containing protein n=1 Tax=Agrobacterium larrymoorei TaxID=160699 RepID=A0A4D7DLI2_9HYPH|nr:AbrB/MazE/SpoVT family DNA-binding domain-containing protein [Agrobacterium larrymoorei]QCI97001.1 AbrB/MazE/SpoVT family DNA-binding domain-containing protein [Agrobacterium larrymoorei]QYA07572.1 AbrB/MazE/SpoVT family DNA-binding domain-containing protein [Agrobacterium larrymoorei]